MLRLIVILVSLAVLAGVGSIALKHGKVWRQGRLVERARECLSRGDFRGASLCARQAVESNPSDIQACRVVGDLAEAARSTNALFWRRRVIELQPANLENHLVLARTALVLGNKGVAKNALGSIAHEGHNIADYHKLRGNLYWTDGQFADAEKHFDEAVRLEPANAVSRMNLQMVRLASTNAQTSALARSELRALTANEMVRADALRQLTTDAIQRGCFTEALAFSRDLLAGSAGPGDQLRHLALLREIKHEDFPPYLVTLQQQCRTNVLLTAMVARWMIKAGLSPEAFIWMNSLPAEVRTLQATQEIIAEALIENSEWRPLIAYLQPLAWNNKEYLRLAMLARATREQRNELAWQGHWLKATKAASENLESLVRLARLAESWGWRDQIDATLGAITAKYPQQKWAEDYLSISLHGAGKTKALQNLFARKMEREPTNNLAKSNLAAVGLLLDPADKRFHVLAEEAFQAEPNNPYIVTSYAVSLYFQQRTAAGLAAIEQLTNDQLETPAIAVWYGFLLAESGDVARAQKRLSFADQTRLLPEEKKLITQTLHRKK